MGIHSSNSIKQYKNNIAEYLNIDTGHVSLFWKGRVALYAILKALGVGKGDEVIIPAFTCVVVPNAIIYLGAKPVYIDIDPLTYNIDVNKIESKITGRTKVILAQNTFGLSPDLDVIIEIANKHNIKVVEDCTHGFGGSYKGKKNGTIADASFYSTQWNKPFSTGIGGIAVVKDMYFSEALLKIEQEALTPSWKESLLLNSLIFAREKLMVSAIYWPALKLYRYLSQKNIIIGSSLKEELQAPQLFPEFLKGMSRIQAKKGIKALKLIDKHNKQRIAVAEKYNEFLHNLGLRKVFQPDYAKHTFLKFPILVKDRKQFAALAERNNIEVGEWFISPIHPVVEKYHCWHYKYGENMVAETIAQKIINLPTHPNINSKALNKILVFLEKNKELLA